MRISGWSSDVCSSDLDADALLGADQAELDGEPEQPLHHPEIGLVEAQRRLAVLLQEVGVGRQRQHRAVAEDLVEDVGLLQVVEVLAPADEGGGGELARSEEHTSELQTLMRSPYAVF